MRVLDLLHRSPAFSSLLCRAILLMLMAVGAPAQSQPLLKATCTPGSGAQCPVESVQVELGKGDQARAMVTCTLRSDGRVTGCRPICSFGEKLDRALIQKLELRRYEPVPGPAPASASPYVFMVRAEVPSGTRCSPVAMQERERAEADSSGLLLPTCRRLETDRCVIEKLELEDRELPYPADVLRRGVQGIARANCSLRVSGRIEACQMQPLRPAFRGPPVDLGPAVREYLQRRRYQPVTLDGKATEVSYAFDVTVRASPKSELGRVARSLQLLVVRDVRARLVAASTERTRGSPICIGGALEGLTNKDLRPLGRELTLAADCEPLNFAGRYIELDPPQRAPTGEVVLGAHGGWMHSSGAHYTYGATTKPLSIQLKGSIEYLH